MVYGQTNGQIQRDMKVYGQTSGQNQRDMVIYGQTNGQIQRGLWSNTIVSGQIQRVFIQVYKISTPTHHPRPSAEPPLGARRAPPVGRVGHHA